jgi:hypothetical protein
MSSSTCFASPSAHDAALRAGQRGRKRANGHACVALIATVGIATLSALALGQTGGLEAQASLAFVTVAAGG